MLKSKRAKILAVIFVLALLLALSGIALMRGHLIRYNVNGVQISRDAFYAYANDAEASDEFTLGCAQGNVALGWLYIFEVQCFDTQEALDAYTAAHNPR